MHILRNRTPRHARSINASGFVRHLGLLCICLVGLVGLTSCSLTDTPPSVSLQPLPTPTPGPSQAVTLRDIHMLDDKSGWALTTDNHVLHTTVGATQWKDVTPTVNTQPTIFGTATFLDAQNGWIAAQMNDKVSIWRTYTGGDFWLETPLPLSGQGIVDISFIDPQNGWLLFKNSQSIGSNANDMPVAVFQTLDGGANWNQNTATGNTTPTDFLPIQGEKTGIRFISLSDGWVTSNSPTDQTAGFYESQNGGNTWKAQQLPTVTNSAIRLVPPTFFNQKEGILPAEIQASNHPVVIYSTQDSGKSWQNTPASSDISANVSFVDSNQGWAVGSSANAKNIYATSDGGKSWQSLSAVANDVTNITVLHFSTKTDGWAIGTTQADAHQLYHSTDGGKSWNAIQTNATS